MLRVLVALCTSFALCASAQTLPQRHVWPALQKSSLGVGVASFKFTVQLSDSYPQRLKDAISRYNNILNTAPVEGPHFDASQAINSVSIHLKSSATTLNNETSYAYSISTEGASLSVSADTIYGAMSALETISQLTTRASDGLYLPYPISITDYPQYSHRGLLVDSGRRFIPTDTVKSIIDGMAYSKMNVLHLHLSDFAAVRIEVPEYPELTNDLEGQYYSIEEAATLVQYANDRGVRIVPEIDVPGHASGFAPLVKEGVLFCDSTKRQLYNDFTTNATLTVIGNVLKSVAKSFPDALFHLGGDETNTTGACDTDNVQRFERSLQELIFSLNRGPVVWNEVFSKPATTLPNAALPGTTIQNWKKSSSEKTGEYHFKSINSEYDVLYLDQECCAAGNSTAWPGGNRYKQCYYTDISKGVDPAELSLISGGETAMWTDLYCPTPLCPQNGTYSWMFSPLQDAVFSQSILGLIWPRAAGAAGAFWKFDSGLDPTSQAYAMLLNAHNTRLRDRGVDSCPNNCACSWGNRCGKPYGGKKTPYNMAVTLINNFDKKVKVKEAFSCHHGYGTELAQISPGEKFTVHTNFIVESATRAGDPYNLWFGGGGWMDAISVLKVEASPNAPTYLEYVVVSTN